MNIKRVRKTFRSTALGGHAPRGFNEGDLVPGSHPLVEAHPHHFEDVEVYVSRKFPTVEQATADPGQKRKLSKPEPEPAPEPESVADAAEGPQRPPTGGPGSGVDAWRQYAAEVTESPVASWAALSRDEIIELLDSEGADNGSE